MCVAVSRTTLFAQLCVHAIPSAPPALLYSAVPSTVKGAHGYLADGLPLRRNTAEMRIVNW